MTKEDFNKLSDLDKLEFAISESLKEHKAYLHKPYWDGSAKMAANILVMIENLKLKK